jgi:putative ABC transport system ATP-binding protein
LLADEPTGNLDSTRAHELLALLRAMVDSDGLTVVMVTHDHELAKTFADRIVLMKDGRVADAETGKISDVEHRSELDAVSPTH